MVNRTHRASRARTGPDCCGMSCRCPERSAGMPVRTKLRQPRRRGSRLSVAGDMPAWLPLWLSPARQQQWLGWRQRPGRRNTAGLVCLVLAWLAFQRPAPRTGCATCMSVSLERLLRRRPAIRSGRGVSGSVCRLHMKVRQAGRQARRARARGDRRGPRPGVATEQPAAAAGVAGPPGGREAARPAGWSAPRRGPLLCSWQRGSGPGGPVGA